MGSAVTIGFDLGGRKLRLGEAEVRWLRAQAEGAAGSSSTARDLAVRFERSIREHGTLVLVRTESRELLRLLEQAERPPEGLTELAAVLRASFGGDRLDKA